MTNVRIELYRVALDPSSYGAGSTFVGRATVNSKGLWTITDTLPGGGCYTAIEARSLIFPPIPYISSEFSATNCRLQLPLVRR